jgi:hypothetical protein
MRNKIIKIFVILVLIAFGLSVVPWAMFSGAAAP